MANLNHYCYLIYYNGYKLLIRQHIRPAGKAIYIINVLPEQFNLLNVPDDEIACEEYDTFIEAFNRGMDILCVPRVFVLVERVAA